MLFSQRMGYKPVREAIQFDSVDTALRNGLWNALHYYWWYKIDKSEWGIDEDVESILTHIWVGYFKKAIDEKPVDMLKSLKHYFLTCKWFEVYDLIEFIANMEPAGKDFADRCNYALEREASAYRLVDNRFVPNTTNEELTEIEEAIDHTNDKKAVELHLRRALELLSDRAQPDYRNSIKESISAVESLTKLISGDQKATLGTALRLIEKDGSVPIHKALSNAYSALYGYTSDSAGIRHALLEGEEPLHFEDAKYMLVSCSAFINYLLAKADKAGKILSL